MKNENLQFWQNKYDTVDTNALLAWDENIGVDEQMGHTPQTARAPANSKMLKSKNKFFILNCSKFEDLMVVVPLAWRSQQNTPKSNKSLNFS